ncbi:MAG: polysaccharide export protein [Tabrizicola sp.]|nr:polysaccharide export protein [Tabrizicola sp.]
MLRFTLGLLLAVLFSTVASAQSAYEIRSGDSLQIEVIEDPSLNRSVLVLPDGSISFPLAGTIPAAGRTVEAVRRDLSAALASNFATSPNVFVGVATLAEPRAASTSARAPAAARTISVYAMGEVTAPGKADVPPGTTILQFLAQAGGFTRFAAENRVQLRRTNAKTGEEQVYLFNYNGKGPSGIKGSTRLQSGDVIVVPQRRLFE